MKVSKPIVFVVDDDMGVREALASLIGSVGLRGSSGFDLQRELERLERRIPIIYITAHGDIPMAVQAMKAGAIDFLSKPFREEDLLDAVRKALERDAAFRARQAEVGEISTR